MNFFLIGFLVMQAARLACGTCVLESDFGFILNCNFKKSGLFRVRNLGGVKAHFGLGFSVGDELGFPESLGNLEGGRRRSVSYKNGPPNIVGVLPSTQQVPTQHPLPDKKISYRSTIQNVPRHHPGAVSVPLMTEARPLPLGVPAFKPIPKKSSIAPLPTSKPLRTNQVAERRSQIAVESPNPRISINNQVVDDYTQTPNTNRTFRLGNPIVSQPIAVPVFQAMPDSISRLTATETASGPETRLIQNHPNYLQFEEPRFDLKDVTVEELAAAANVTVDTIKHAIYVREQQMKAEHRAMLAAKLRQEFIRTSTKRTTLTTTTTSTTTSRPKPINVPQFASENNGIGLENKISKVMNAPKEYYPVGYDKNFDDNFKSKVDLPPTSFSCSKQKHFPGLYADVDLGCMVFHVCALTDDGLVRKSFLCPENTLFDQTILKCNWWFYVDCLTSKSIYDSNIPISKSYQLMKSLTYFSKLNRNKDNDNGDIGLDIQSLKDSMESRGRQLSEQNPIEVPESEDDTTKGDLSDKDEISVAEKTVQDQDQVQPLKEES